MRMKKPVPGKSSVLTKDKGKWARDDRKVTGDAAPVRADRPAYKKGGAVKGGTKVNIVIAPQGGAAPMAPAGLAPPLAKPALPMAPPAGPPPNVVPGAPAGISGKPPMASPMATGGRVSMTAGAGSGKGRMQKAGRTK